MRGFKPGQVTIGGDDYAAAVSRMPETFIYTERGKQAVQNLKVSVSKELLEVAPKQGSQMTVEGLAFKIVEVGGFDAEILTGISWASAPQAQTPRQPD